MSNRKSSSRANDLAALQKFRELTGRATPQTSVSMQVAEADYLKTKDGRILPRSSDQDESKISKTVYHNQLKQALEESNGNISEYLKEERRISRIYFNHHENSPLPEKSVKNSKTAKNLSQPSISMSDVDVNYNSLLKTVGNYFSVIINQFERKENIKIAQRGKIHPNFSTREGILDFYNKAALQMGDRTLNTTDYFQEILNEYIGFSKKPVEQQKLEMLTFQKQLENMLSQIDSLLRQQMLGKEQSDQFWSLYSLLNGKILNFFKDHDQILSQEDLDQITKSGVTLNELLEQVSLSIKFAKLAKDKSSGIEKIEVIGIGSSRNEEFQNFADSLVMELEKDIINEGQFETFMAKYTKKKILENSKKFYTEGKKKGQPVTTSVKNILTATMNPSKGYGDETSISDIRIIITLKNGQIITENIDAKLGMNSRYTQSTSIKNTFSNYEKEGDKNTDTKIFSQFLELFISSVLTNYIFNYKGDKIESQLKKIGTMFSLVSDNMIDKYGLDATKLENSDLIVVTSKYMWFSDFLKLLKRHYIDNRQGTQSSISLNIMDIINSSAVDIQKIKNNLEDLPTLFKDKEFQNIVKDITNKLRMAEVSFKVDIKDFFTK